MGVTGVIAALGDTLFPASSLAAGISQDLDRTSNILVRMRVFHPALAAGAGALLVFYALWAAATYPQCRRWAWTLSALVGAQVAAGILNLLLLAPVGMQLTHLLLADLLWISLVLVAASTLAED
jgi:heme A synthase